LPVVLAIATAAVLCGARGYKVISHSATIAKLARNVRRVFDYLRMTENSIPRPLTPCDHSV
jgi:hypothetical protein